MNISVYSVDFIKKNPVAALLLSCGLGKTVTTLTAINDLMFDDFEVHEGLGGLPFEGRKRVEAGSGALGASA